MFMFCKNCIVANIKLYLCENLDPPSTPLNVIFTTVTISWTAPLDTPLCVQSYTVTVRNSCNSSQVMVYNTTDNRSSLTITDLSSDGEYSVIVAGRDGEGWLGQESVEVQNIMILKELTYILVGSSQGWFTREFYKPCNQSIISIFES